jgi:hypothetical protein
MDLNLSKEERGHLQQLVRDLVQGDTAVPFGTAERADAFDKIPYIVKQVLQVIKYSLSRTDKRLLQITWPDLLLRRRRKSKRCADSTIKILSTL